ncbi:endogenous retrovirus group K member 24 Gag polyprotein-like [Pipra filicauda]|uniref:Endogenous retrovirus group K member 24 Gag polyprotein-like n=1 Tax=Pipra filicauda TaxID=649802 RepID=A0A7R5KE57_9PASS|nr:endogenous retrovirus group K member 24 Gag polyprotein-like [Pipra filicauda]
MGLSLSTPQKFVYRKLKDFILENGHPLDKKSAKTFAKWFENRGEAVSDSMSLKDWEKIGYNIWRAKERGDKTATEALIASRLILMMLQHQLMSSNENLQESPRKYKNSNSKSPTKDKPRKDEHGGREKSGAGNTRSWQHGDGGGGEGRLHGHGAEACGGRSRERTPRGNTVHKLFTRALLVPPPSPPTQTPSAPPPSPPSRPSPYAPGTTTDPPTRTPSPSSAASTPTSSPSRGRRKLRSRVRASSDGNIQKDGHAHEAFVTEAPGSCRMPKVSLPCKDIWKAFRTEASQANDAEFLKAFPIYLEEGRAPEWRPVSYTMLKDIKKAIVEYGLGSPYTVGLFESFFLACRLIPYDIKAVINGLLSTVQASVFEEEWKRLIVKYVNEKMERRGIPVKNAIDMLYGEGNYASRQDQARVDLKYLDITKDLAMEAFKKVADAYVQTPSFTLIHQGSTEPFVDFTTRLREAIARQVKQKENQDILFNKLVSEKANEDFQQALKMLKDPTLLEMIEACKNVGSNLIKQD